MPPPVAPIVSTTAPTPDPRVGLTAGRWDAGAGGVEHADDLDDAAEPRSRWARRTRTSRSVGKYAIQGNYNGFEIYDISNPAKPVLVHDVSLPGVAERRVGVQEPAVHVVGSDATAARTAGSAACPIRSARSACAASAIFDIADLVHPKLVTSVQTCRGSHTHTVVDAAGRQRQRLHLRLGHGRRAVGRGTAGLPGRRHRRSEHGALPARSDQGAARGARRHAAIVSSPRIFNGPAGAAAQRRARGRGRGEPC